MTTRTFDREIRFDDRSRDFPIRSTFKRLKDDEPRSYTWACEPHLDQGPDGACVGFSFAHEIAARPRVHPTDYDLATQIYRRAKQIDEWAGEDYDGTSVLAGAKVLEEMGYISGYRWAFSLEEALVGISRRGPAVIGCWWWEGMFETDDSGFIRPTGQRVGGHAILATAVNVKQECVRLHQSWGDSWGDGGDCYMTFEDFERILLDQGECCFPEGRL